MTSIPVPVQVIKDLKGSDYSWSYQTPPSSPGSSSSRKSSMCRSVEGRHGEASTKPAARVAAGPTVHSSCVTEGFASGEGEYTLGTGLREGLCGSSYISGAATPCLGPCSGHFP